LIFALGRFNIKKSVQSTSTIAHPVNQNRYAANALGFIAPPTLLVQADEAIE
jgi:hypothetical protein